MPSKTPKARVPTPLPNGEVPKRKSLILTCSECGLTLPTMAFEDPEQGEGWPQHRCATCKLSVQPFDAQHLDPFKPVKGK